MKVEETYVSFTRKELYDLLSDMPMTKIAQKYHLDTFDLSRRIRENDIPIRTSGDWTRISMGKKVERSQLEGNPNASVIVRRISSESSAKSPSKKPRLKTTATPLPSTSYPFVYPRIPYPVTPPKKSESKNEIKSSITPRGENLPIKKKRKSKMENNSTTKKKTSRASLDTQIAQKKLAEYNQKQRLYEALNILPDEKKYNRITVFDLNLPVRAINCLMRSQIENLHIVLYHIISNN